MIETLSVIFVCLLLIYLLLLWLGFWLRHESRFDKPADAAIVMGSFPMKALPRVQKAAQLYHQGLVRKLILSGKPLNGTLTEAQWMYQEATKLGVPKVDLILEECATNSKENMLYARPIIEKHNFKSVIIIQQEFSQVRGFLTAKKQFADLSLRLINQPASAEPYWNRWTWMFHRIGWRYTWTTVSRLFKYRLKGDI
ncbi:MAG: YdcF family protein [Chloroflexi bacterium]|nr:MAG: YdcF family protein [Chloroflexota bacterium]